MYGILKILSKCFQNKWVILDSFMHKLYAVVDSILVGSGPNSIFVSEDNSASQIASPQHANIIDPQRT